MSPNVRSKSVKEISERMSSLRRAGHAGSRVPYTCLRFAIAAFLAICAF